MSCRMKRACRTKYADVEVVPVKASKAQLLTYIKVGCILWGVPHNCLKSFPLDSNGKQC